jgi:hypothetical protein
MRSYFRVTQAFRNLNVGGDPNYVIQLYYNDAVASQTPGVIVPDAAPSTIWVRPAADKADFITTVNQVAQALSLVEWKFGDGTPMFGIYTSRPQRN